MTPHRVTATRVTALILPLAIASCIRKPPPPPAPTSSPHYVLSQPYQAGGTWYYPSETYALETTGIATVQPSGQTGLTFDGELRDDTLASAAMQTIQLPAIAEVTNLENGRQILLRVNDRGPASPARVIALSPRAALLLAMPPSGAARVKIRIDDPLSHQVVEQLGGNGQKLDIAPAPAAPVREEALPPPGSHAAAGPSRIIGAAQPEAQQTRVPDRLPERIIGTTADPGELYLRVGTFSRYSYARQEAATLSGLGGDVIKSGIGHQTSFAVRAGPFRTIPEADSALTEALRDGILDARITVE